MTAPFRRFFDLLIMIKLVGVWLLAVAEGECPECSTRPCLIESQRRQQSEDVETTEEAWRQDGLMGERFSALPLIHLHIFLELKRITESEFQWHWQRKKRDCSSLYRSHFSLTVMFHHEYD